ncbi:MAG: hypothetical protein K2I08_02250, partial [Muribaculaceae bacterium]|nr:hypothetical protein [Muribaculaceae bacterium]
MVGFLLLQNQDDTIKRLSEATELLLRVPRTEVRGFGMITALRAVKSATNQDTELKSCVSYKSGYGTEIMCQLQIGIRNRNHVSATHRDTDLKSCV